MRTFILPKAWRRSTFRDSHFWRRRPTRSMAACSISTCQLFKVDIENADIERVGRRLQKWLSLKVDLRQAFGKIKVRIDVHPATIDSACERTVEQRRLVDPRSGELKPPVQNHHIRFETLPRQGHGTVQVGFPARISDERPHV